MVSDRLGSAEVPMTQEFMATMLGVLRPAVTVAARLFQQRGLIRYARGHIVIVDRPALLATSCECYAMPHSQHTTNRNNARMGHSTLR